MATKTHPYTTSLQYGTDGLSWSTLADLESVDPPTLERGVAKATHLSSANKTKEKVPGWRDPGKVNFKVYHSQAQYVILVAQYSTETVYYYRILYPLIGAQVTPSQHIFTGFITKLDIPQVEAESEDLFYNECEIDVTGLPVFTVGA